MKPFSSIPKAVMFLEVESNPNAPGSVSMVYRDVSPPREVFCIQYRVGTEDQPVRVTGWDAETSRPCPAYACLVEESGDGTALLIYGGSGGIRLKGLEDESDWDVQAQDQWGESHLVYPARSFIVYRDQV